MSHFDPDGTPENEWDDGSDIAWNEFDWERYLREQDDAIHRYARLYEAAANSTDRLDTVAEKMGWDRDDEKDEDSAAPTPQEWADEFFAYDVYTLHKNPIFIATKAICLCLRCRWETPAGSNPPVPQPLAVAFLIALQRSEEQATQAIHALDFGDYALAVSLFKRALAALNSTLALLNADEARPCESLPAWRTAAQSRLFDLREIWLRVITECRAELDRPVDEES